ncbi:SPOR domain-containing protein [Sphingomicrobium arenosum]|uniref:SPOR domain-containing protein n=1 Tax=Sphingomicrobium arenosum TaxID=2233861 RepID=UPI00223FD09A|nr:SPOR domain-containing protein [Sphingomicrobium arenosum]
MSTPIFSALLLALAPAPPSSEVAQGIAAWRGGEHERAVAIWAPLAEAGDRDALFNLGQAYRLGRGVAVDKNRARGLFERAARQGHMGARTNLGLMLFGQGERAEGLRWLRDAADAGEPRAMLVYGTALFNGETLTRDMVTGYALVSRAAARDLAPAKTTLAEMDRLLPVETRRRGVALAQSLATGQEQLATILEDRREAAAAPRPTPPVTRPPPRLEPSVEAGVDARSAAQRMSAMSSGTYSIQLGAFTQEGAAEGLYAELQDMPALAGKSPLYVDGGGITRLRITGFADAASAERACAALEASGRSCFTIRP